MAAARSLTGSIGQKCHHPFARSARTPSLRGTTGLKVPRIRHVAAKEARNAEKGIEELRLSDELDLRPAGNGALSPKSNGTPLSDEAHSNGSALNGSGYVGSKSAQNGYKLNGSNGSVPNHSMNGAKQSGVPSRSKTKLDYSSNGAGPSMSQAASERAKISKVVQPAGGAHRRARDARDGGAEPGPASEAFAAAAVEAADSTLSPRATAASGSNDSAAPKAAPYMAPGGKWSNFKKYSTLQRTWQIWSFAFVFAIKVLSLKWKITYGRKGMTPERVTARKCSLAAWLREGLIRLGPTFIKIGQQFSTRVDVLSKEFVSELEKLQDNVPAFDSQEAVAIVERNLGKPILQSFESFEMTPIAAASLGQVHLAKLRGETVVVKIQRPGLKSLFDIDLKNIRVLAQWLQKLDPQSDGAARDWVAIYDECSRILYQEIDYELEGKNADRFRTNFAGKPWIKVPKIDWEFTTTEILTMEYCPGVKINNAAALDAQNIDRKRLAKLSVECYLEQLLTYGFFHADPHPGNIAVDATGGGRLIYYDFGMMGEIPKDIRAGLLELFYGVYEKDPDRCIGALITMGVLIPGNDMTAVRRTAKFFLTNFEERLKAQKEESASNPDYDANFKGKRSKEDKKKMRKAILSNIGEDLLVASADKPFRFPATFTFVVRSFTVLDGIGKSLNPRFDISEIAAPYARGLLLEARPQFARLAETFKKKAGLQNRAVKNLFTGPNMIEDVAVTMKQLQSGDLKLRVRALEAERALDRVQASQKSVTAAIVASTLTNVGVVLSVSAKQAAANAAFAGAALMMLVTLAGLLKVRKQQKKELMLTAAA